MLDNADWIWCPDQALYGVLRRRLPRPSVDTYMEIQCAAFDRYELYIDGTLVLDGGLPGDLGRWVPVDTAKALISSDGDKDVMVDVFVYHSGLKHVHYRGKSLPGFCAEFFLDGESIVTGGGWEACALSEWSTSTERMNHLLDPLESFDQRRERWFWGDGNSVDFTSIRDWCDAVIVDRPKSSSQWWVRPDCFPTRALCKPKRHRMAAIEREVGRSGTLADYTKEIGALRSGFLGEWTSYAEHGVTLKSPDENLVMVDFDDEIVGFPSIQVSSSVPVVVNVGWSERLGEQGFPILHSKGTSYIARFRLPAGDQCIRTFQWSGFRYLLIHIDSESDVAAEVHLLINGIRRIVQPRQTLPNLEEDGELSSIRKLCRFTLEQTLPEMPCDCPTREKAHYWADGFFISFAWEKCYQDPRFMTWYLEAFRRVPLREDGLFSSVYPGNHKVLIDMCLIPVIGIGILWDYREECPVDQIYFEKTLQVLTWFEQHTMSSGLVEAGEWNADANDLVFLDHPGLPWHNFNHPGLDRRDPSAILNLYYLYALQSVCRMAEVFAPELISALASQAGTLRQSILEAFYHEGIIWDSPPSRFPDAGISWLANSLGVLTQVIPRQKASFVMEQMVDRFDEICRCSPGAIYWFLSALEVAELDEAGEATLVRLFKSMLRAGAVATWETFDGEIEDSLCHPWLAAPVCLYLERRSKSVKRASGEYALIS